MALNLLDDHISALARKLPVLYRRRMLVLLGLLALHLFIVAPFVRLSTDEQRYRAEADSSATRSKHLQAVETDIRSALDQIDRQKTLLLEDLVARFRELNNVRNAIRLPLESRSRDNAFQSADQLQALSREEHSVNKTFAEAVAAAEQSDDKAAAYRDLIQYLILEPAFTKANQRWQDQKTAIAARLKRIRSGLPTDRNLQGIDGLLTEIEEDIRRHRFSAPQGDWWMTVQGKKSVLDSNLGRITSTLNKAIMPLAAVRDKLNEEIEAIKARLAATYREKEELAMRAAERFQRIENSLNIGVVDGVQVITWFPVLLAAALALMTADICRCLQELSRCRQQVDSGLQREIAQWLAIAARLPYLLDFMMALWIFLAALHVRPLTPDNTFYAGQLLFGAVTLATIAVWENVARHRAMAAVTGERASTDDASA